MTVNERLRDKAGSLPLTPGVYIMKNADGEVIYVGKSKKLKNRVTSYFVGTHTSAKTARMVSLVRDFDYIVCDTEIEALTLENVLIKKHSPKYNIKLKDAKSYPYIKVTGGEYPRLCVTRERKSDKSRYFGPYDSASDAYLALECVMRIFRLPTCKRRFPEDIGKGRPCIYREIGRCLAPCVEKSITAEDYRALVKRAERVLDGDIKDTVLGLEREMNEAAELFEFERAAVLRDSILALRKLAEKQKVVADAKVNRDVFALYTEETVGVLAILTIREGALVNKNEFILSSSELTGREDAVSLIADYYDGRASIPREVMLDFDISDDDVELLSEYISLGTKYKVSVRVPERGDGRALCDMALENAKEAARQAKLEGEREDKSVRRLAELLGLDSVPSRIEAYDISNIGNENIVASMVVWQGGKLKRSDYRSFNIKTTSGQDDYASMREALSRRLLHIGDGTPSLGERPDVILLDGGVGHVSAVSEVMHTLNLDIPLFGMVKDDYHKTRAITDGKTEISIAREMNVYTFVYNLQEEAHRFAGKQSSGAKRKTLRHSSLEKIEGIGPKKAKILLHAMPLSKIRGASVDELSKIRGISERDAERIRAYFEKSE
ncbi:MAG: excinuclease ABC subunit UvrC [Clostridia bacterium]|nr:excinuclease ABC subunit UvrC [Clostridia bacterium]